MGSSFAFVEKTLALNIRKVEAILISVQILLKKKRLNLKAMPCLFYLFIYLFFFCFFASNILNQAQTSIEKSSKITTWFARSLRLSDDFDLRFNKVQLKPKSKSSESFKGSGNEIEKNKDVNKNKHLYLSWEISISKSKPENIWDMFFTYDITYDISLNFNL